jgi:hypothetical protein
MPEESPVAWLQSGQGPAKLGAKPSGMPQPLRKTILLVVLALLAFCPPACAQLERANDASLLLRTASFGQTMGSSTTYVLTEYQPDHWIVQAQNSPPSSLNWAVTAAPMGGANAGYVVFTNGENESMTLDVLKIDECYGTSGDIRIGW